MQLQMPHLFRRWQVLLVGLGLFALVFVVFSPALKNGFVGYDDPEYVTGNWHVQTGLSWAGVKWAFTTFEAANWHPLTWLSHQLDAELFGLQAWGHHLTSLLLHSLNAALLFMVLRNLTGATWRSLLVAALFAVHPLRVESAAWISERKDVLSATFFFLTLLAYVAYGRARLELPERGRPGPEQSTATGQQQEPAFALNEHRCGRGRRHSAARYHFAAQYVVCLALYCLGLMCKPMLVTLPFVLLLLDYWPLRRFKVRGERFLFRGVLVEKIPFFLAAFAAVVVTVVAQGRGGAILEDAPLASRVANASVSYARYLGKLVWPVDLSAFYPPVPHWPGTVVLASALLILGLLAWGIMTRRRFPWLLVGWFWFFGMLVPVIGLVQSGEQSMADRYTYLPCIGLLIAVVWSLEHVLVQIFRSVHRGSSSGESPAAAQIMQALSQGSPRYLGLGTWVVLLLACGALSGLAVLTVAQIRHWHNTETLFAHALRLDPGNYLALNNLGAAADREGREQEAVSMFTQALRARPGYAHAHNNFGAVLLKAGRADEAVEQFQLAVKSAPAYADAHNNLGAALDRQGKNGDALRHFAEACRLNPYHADARYNLGLQLMRQGHFGESIPHFQAAIRLRPASADAHNNLGFAFQQLKQLDAAIAAYRQALRLSPDYARAHFNLGVALVEINRFDEAIAEFRTALRIRPDYAEAQKNLKSLLDLKQQ